ncbi:MAG: TetR/AcrR family transcriptional regulator [Actinobacteria bacterium]|nr:TetR/AcrR family transcriptional regulator [Actinomycetota bacterium]
MTGPETPITLQTKRFSEPEIKIIRGTYHAMARIGSQQLSLRRIAKELEVSPALLVYHFGSRDRLLIETMHWALAGTVRRINRQIQGIGDPEEALTVLIDAIFVSPKENRDYHLIYMDLVQYAVRKESFSDLTQLIHEHVNDSYAVVIRRGVESGTFCVDDIDSAARTVRAIVEGGFLQWLQEDDWMDTHERLQRECDSSLRSFLAPSSG